MDASAVLEDTEEVGGPDENIDRLGVLNNDGWFTEGAGGLTGVEAARLSSGAELG
jgi:hypothetical protein